MQPRHPNTPEYWTYFLALEQDFFATDRYVCINSNNAATFSIEYAQLLLRIGSEIDTLFKVYFELHGISIKRPNIDSYKELILAKMPNFVKGTVRVDETDLEFVPWASWDTGDNPIWWKAYNEVKHERYKNFEKANLRNTLEALSGLFILSGHLYSQKLQKFLHNRWPQRLKTNIYQIQLSYRSDPIDVFGILKG